MFVCVCSYVLLEDEAGQQGGGLFDRQIVEEAVENHLRQQELVATAKINAQSELLDDITLSNRISYISCLFLVKQCK